MKNDCEVTITQFRGKQSFRLPAHYRLTTAIRRRGHLEKGLQVLSMWNWYIDAKLRMGLLCVPRCFRAKMYCVLAYGGVHQKYLRAKNPTDATKRHNAKFQLL